MGDYIWGKKNFFNNLPLPDWIQNKGAKDALVLFSIHFIYKGQTLATFTLLISTPMKCFSQRFKKFISFRSTQNPLSYFYVASAVKERDSNLAANMIKLANSYIAWDYIMWDTEMLLHSRGKGKLLAESWSLDSDSTLVSCWVGSRCKTLWNFLSEK